jgi:hypothetical protein
MFEFVVFRGVLSASEPLMAMFSAVNCLCIVAHYIKDIKRYFIAGMTAGAVKG